VGITEQYVDVTSVLDTCIAVPNRAVFGTCEKGAWGGLLSAGKESRLTNVAALRHVKEPSNHVEVGLSD
jgi:hypothetical protein